MHSGTPLKPAVFHILLALLPGDTHGYAIMQAVREQSQGQLPLRTGSLYRHLSAMLDAGLIATVERPAGDDRRRSDYYRLTRTGRHALAAERERLTRLVSALDTLDPPPRRSRS